MKSVASYCLFVFALSSLSTYNVVGVTIRRSSSASDVDALRKAVNNAFDALSKVHEAIGNLQDDAHHSSNNNNYKSNAIQIQALDDTNVETKRSNEEGKSSDRSNEKIERRSEAEKKSLESSSIDDEVLKRSQDEKFIEEVKELEDVMSNRKKEDGMEKTKKDEAEEAKEVSAKKEKNKRKNSDDPQKLISLFGKGKRASNNRVSKVTDDFSDEDIKQSVDFLVDVLKGGLQDEAKDSKLKDLLTTMLEKDAALSVTDEKQNRRKDQSSSVEATAGKMKKRKDQSSSAAITHEELKRKASSLSADKGVKTKKLLQAAEKRNRNAELNAVSSSLGARKSTTENELTTAEKKESKTRESSSSVKSDTGASASLLKEGSMVLRSKIKRGERELNKRNHADAVLREASTSRRFEDEVQELVNMILKRKELLKREKLKMALSDMFREMESKVMDEANTARESAHVYSRRSTDKEGSELRKFAEDMLLLDDKVM